MNLISTFADFPILESTSEMGVQQPVSATESSRLETSGGEATEFPLASTLRQDVQKCTKPRTERLPFMPRAGGIRQPNCSNFAAEYCGHMTNATR